MTSIITKLVTKKILGETVANKFGTEDPYFDHVPATRLGGKANGKVKKRKKALPPGITDNDAKVLTKVKRRAYRLDLCLFSCFGIRFGWGSVIGLVPAIGDVLDMLLALLVMRSCMKIDGGLPTSVKGKMVFNILVDFVVGLVPFAGDLVDAAYKCNTRNVVLLESHLREEGRKNLKKSGLPVPAVDPSEADEFDRLQAQDPPEYISNPPSRNPSMSDRRQRSRSRSRSRDRRRDDRPVEPVPARVRESRGFFGRSRARPDDIETGEAGRGSRRQRSPRRERR
ncbi:hypothetical protein FVEN_g8006 [Fusarium venenatum]|uniref:DUF4112 domain-containing protein n=1 Tax=Fusarium venenatum TaxID=56646 RepID=A0A2L2TRN4_9HYPO|nr:uncharacterized protein FVRRES_08828 [Fusarium venenatum]KAG8354160.1 hypothetical protein FVEN_g8006 [Fusarium venenatum]KAH6965565.1 hypothetical protein EDB82DRAFT_479925 [Fusarium venenatum]CEI68751.1 unnamed protein product [Fusarium venenatum]